MRWGWSDEGDFVLATQAGKIGVLTEKTVAWMNPVTLMLDSGLDNLRAIQIGSSTSTFKYNSGVDSAIMQRGLIVLRADADGLDAHVASGSGDTNSDFATVGDQ